MISPKKLVNMARKWQRLAVIGRKRILLPTASCSRGNFVIYTIDKKRYIFPIEYLNNYVFQELLKLSEEEFGLPRDGPITLTCDAAFMDYAVSFIRHQATTEDIEKALLISVVTRSSLSCSFCQLETSQQLVVC